MGNQYCANNCYWHVLCSAYMQCLNTHALYCVWLRKRSMNINRKYVFHFHQAYKETENMFKVDITHIQWWSMCCVRVCYYPTLPIFNSSKDGDSKKKIHFPITFWSWMGYRWIQLTQSWNGKMLTGSRNAHFDKGMLTIVLPMFLTCQGFVLEHPIPLHITINGTYNMWWGATWNNGNYQNMAS